MPTHYEILGISQAARPDQVKRSYRTLVKRYHPDLFPSGSLEQSDAAVRMRKIIDAYAILSNTRKRAMYDAMLKKRASSFVEPIPEHCHRCGKPTLYWQIGRERPVCDGCAFGATV